jgi:hypothetical protein
MPDLDNVVDGLGQHGTATPLAHLAYRLGR